jgi:hypothetical protein
MTHRIQNVVQAAARVGQLGERFRGWLDGGRVRYERLGEAQTPEFECRVAQAEAELEARGDVLCIEPLRTSECYDAGGHTAHTL